MARISPTRGRADVYRGLFVALKATRDHSERTAHLGRIASALARDSWNEAGVTLRIEGRRIAIAGFDPVDPRTQVNVENPGWNTPRSRSRTIEIDAVAPFPAEVNPLVERVFLPLEKGELPPIHGSDTGTGPSGLEVWEPSRTRETHAGPAVPLIIIEEWRSRLERGTPSDAEEILADFSSLILAHYTGTNDLATFIPPLMSFARRCEETFRDIGTATRVRFALIDAAEDLEPVSPETADRTVRILMQSTRRSWNPDVPFKDRDRETTLDIFRGLLERGAIIERYQSGSILILLATIQDIAHRATILEAPRADRDAEMAMRLWGLLLDHHALLTSADPDAMNRLVNNMRSVAHMALDINKPSSEQDATFALGIWEFLVRRREIINQYREDNTLGIIKAMFDVAEQAGRGGNSDALHVRLAVQIALRIIALREFADAESPQFRDTAIGVLFHHCKKSFSVVRDDIFKFKSGDGALDAYLQSGAFYLSGEFSSAVRVIDNFGREDPVLLSLKTGALNKMRRYEEAERSAFRALESCDKHDPSYWTQFARAHAHFRLGDTYVATGKFSQAIEHYEIAVRIAQRHNLVARVKMMMRLATWYERQGRASEAIELTNEILQIVPDHAAANGLHAKLS